MRTPESTDARRGGQRLDVAVIRRRRAGSLAGLVSNDNAVIVRVRGCADETWRLHA